MECTHGETATTIKEILQKIWGMEPGNFIIRAKSFMTVYGSMEKNTKIKLISKAVDFCLVQKTAD